jgi:hypothetical protein
MIGRLTANRTALGNIFRMNRSYIAAVSFPAGKSFF